jgi:putative endonuclease
VKRARNAERCFVYLLGCSDTHGLRTYVGWTNDIGKRLARHNGGKGARSTRGRAWHLLYVEYFDDRREAMRREYFLKRARGLRRKLSAGISLRSAVP